MEIKICHIYPDVLNLYGDKGNIVTMQQRLLRRGIDCSVKNLNIGETARLSEFDIAFIGGGQDFEQEALLDDLHKGKDIEIKSAIDDGVTFLAICGGYQMLGQYYETYENNRCDFIGAVPLYTVGGKDRLIGNFVFSCEGIGSVVGFENHSGKTYLTDGVLPLGMVQCGFGNNGEDGTEGVRYKNVFGSYSHGPLLPKNPLLCDEILKTALERKYGKTDLTLLNDEAENAAHSQMLQRLLKNKT